MSYWLLDVVGKTNQPVQIFPDRLPIPPPARVPAHSSTKQQGQKHKTWWKTDFANVNQTTSSYKVKFIGFSLSDMDLFLYLKNT